MPKLNIAFDGKTSLALREFVAKYSDIFASGDIYLKVNDLLAEIGIEWLKDLSREIQSETWVDVIWMIDGKWYDIPNTVANYAKRLDWLNIAYYTVHASGGPEMIRAAKSASPNKKLLAITILTSMKDDEVSAIYDADRADSILRLAKSALSAWADGLVCSPTDAPMLRQVFGDAFLLVTPNIAREGIERNDDQNKSLTNTPRWAIENWVSDIVVGRPILAAENPGEVIREMLEQMSATHVSLPHSPHLGGGVEDRGSSSGGVAIPDFSFEKILHTGDWESLLKYIGAIYRRPDEGAYVRLASKLLSDGYVNVWATERDYRVLARASTELADQVRSAKIQGNIVLGAQMGSVRLSETLARALSISQSIYTEKDGESMALKRHDLGTWAFAGKQVILSEDVITKGSTLAKMIEIVETGGGTVVAVTCVVNRSGTDHYRDIPLYTCYTPPVFGMWHDDSTPDEARGTTPRVPDDGESVEKPKNEWNRLVMSMR